MRSVHEARGTHLFVHRNEAFERGTNMTTTEQGNPFEPGVIKTKNMAPLSARDRRYDRAPEAMKDRA